MLFLLGAKGCTFFSIPAIIFLVIIAILLDKQPLYIQGPEDYAKSIDGVYSAAYMYAGTFVISLSYWCYFNSKNGLPLPISFLNSSRPPSPMAAQGGQTGSYDEVRNN